MTTCKERREEAGSPGMNGLSRKCPELRRGCRPRLGGHTPYLAPSFYLWSRRAAWGAEKVFMETRRRSPEVSAAGLCWQTCALSSGSFQRSGSALLFLPSHGIPLPLRPFPSSKTGADSVLRLEVSLVCSNGVGEGGGPSFFPVRRLLDGIPKIIYRV